MRRLPIIKPQRFVIFLLLYCTSILVFADIATDGSLGQATSLSGPNYQVEANLGEQVGENLFHSFNTFSLQNGETASFNGPDSVNNVIGRVTGSQASNIDGTIHSSIPNANVYLINPNGIIFGENAQIDIQGSFHGLTSDYIEFNDGGKFYSSTSLDSVLTSAAPSAFGFLTDNPGDIIIKSNSLTMKPGKDFTLIGGDIDISIADNEAGIVTDSGGNISIASVAGVGTVSVNSGIVNATEIQKGRVNLHGHAGLSANTESANAGNITIVADQLTLSEFAEIHSDTRGTGHAGNITLTANTITMGGDNTRVSTNSLGDFATGNAGNITVTTNNLEMHDSSVLSSSSVGVAGNAGNIIVDTQTLHMEDKATIQATLRVDELNNNTDSPTPYQSGNIEINASNIVLIGDSTGADNGVVISSEVSRAPENIPGTRSIGEGGSVEINADTLLMKNDVIIAVKNEGEGSAGDITINLDSNLSSENGFIQSNAATGDGGNISIHANQHVDLNNTRILTSVADAQGSGGNINLETALLVLEGSDLNASSAGSVGGNINLQIDTFLRASEPESRIDASGVVNGVITISSPEVDLGKVLKKQDADLLINNVKDPCSIQVASDESSLTIQKQAKGCTE